VFKTTNNYIANELSAFYLDYTKDILYIEKADSHDRRSIQTVLYHHALDMVRLLAPIIPHTADDVYSHIPGTDEFSVYLTDMPEPAVYENAKELLEKWNEVFVIRQHVLKALEDARNEKIIGKSLTASVSLYVGEKAAQLLKSLNANLQQIFIVSNLEVSQAAPPKEAVAFEDMSVLVNAAEGKTCDRCWQVVEAVNEQGVCSRCAEVIKG